MASGRPKITVVGAGNVGASVAQYTVEKELGDVVLVDVIEGVPQGKSLDLAQAGPIHRYDSTLIGSNGYDETADSDIVVDHRRPRAQAGHDPRRSALQERRDRRRRRREDRRPLAQRDPDPRHESARRHGAARVEEVGLSEQARDRDGGHPRLGAIPPVHRPRAERVGRERHRVRARRPRRHDGPAAALLDGRGHSDHRAAARRRRSTRSCSARRTAAPRSSRS